MKITIEFLDGLTDWLNSDDKDIGKFISGDDASLLVSFNNEPLLSQAKHEMISNSFHSIKNEFIVFYKERSEIIVDDKDKTDNIWVKVKTEEIKTEDVSKSGFIQLWSHRWISLFILNKLISKEKNKEQMDSNYKDKLINLVIYSGNLVPSYLKNLRNADLSGADLHQANLFRADLSGANLSEANLFRADLSDANISDASLFSTCLKEANLSRTNLSDANISDANLSDAKFSYANLNYAVLAEADLSKANFSYASLTDANLSYATLSNTDLSYASLTDANLSYATLSNTDLSYTNLSDAYLSHAFLFDCNKYTNLICRGTDFDSSYIDNEKLLRYIQQNKAFNVPQEVNYRASEKPLEVISKYPDVDKEAPIYSFIVAKFNKLLNGSTINTSTVKLVKITDDRMIEGTVSLLSSDGKTIIFIPSHTLEPTATYKVTISSGVRDLFNSNIAGDILWSLNTARTNTLENLPIFGITASGDDGNIALNTIDNDLNTRWSCPGIGSWIKLDLGKEKTVYNIQIAWFKGNRRKYNYKIQISNVQEDRDIDLCENSTQNNRVLSSSGNKLLPEACEIVPTEGRYVKIIVYGNNMNNWASITEIDVYGTGKTS